MVGQSTVNVFIRNTAAVPHTAQGQIMLVHKNLKGRVKLELNTLLYNVKKFLLIHLFNKH